VKIIGSPEKNGLAVKNKDGPNPGSTVENANGIRMILQTGDYIRLNTPGKTTLFRLVGARELIEICEADFLSMKHRCKVKLPIASFVPPVPSDWEVRKPFSGSGGGRDGRKLEE
jgi:hypothetical protein